MFVDSHAHLDMETIRRRPRAMISHARAKPASRRLSPLAAEPGLDHSTAEFDWRSNTILCSLPWVFIRMRPDSLRKTIFTNGATGASSDKVIAWGEIGLDYFYDHSPRELQQQVFHAPDGIGARSEAANRDSLPAFRRQRKCLGRLPQSDGQHWKPSGLGGILHCFTGPWIHAKRALDLGFMISFAGNITFPKAQPIRDAAREVPLDRLFIETDSPFLAPVPNRGKRNEPAFVKEMARQIG